MSSSVDKIKERLNIVDVISSYIKLERSGGNFKAKCPFHNEKTPSFSFLPSAIHITVLGAARKGIYSHSRKNLRGWILEALLKFSRKGLALNSFRKIQN